MLRTIELPTQMPIVSSILFFIAIHTEVTYSTVFAWQIMSSKALRGNVGYTHDNGKKDEADKCLWYIVPFYRLLDRRDN